MLQQSKVSAIVNAHKRQLRGNRRDLTLTCEFSEGSITLSEPFFCSDTGRAQRFVYVNNVLIGRHNVTG